MKKQVIIILVMAAGATSAFAQSPDTGQNSSPAIATTASQPSTSANGSTGIVATNGYGRRQYVAPSRTSETTATGNYGTNNMYSSQSYSLGNTNTNAPEHHHWWQLWR